MLQWARAVVGIVSDILRLGVLFLRSSSAIRAENLVLRRQLARCIRAWYKTQTRGSRNSSQPRAVHQTLRFAQCGGQRASIDHRSLASTGLGDLLALEVQGRSATDSARTTRPDSQDGRREPAMGRRANSQRAIGQARDPGVAENSRQVHAEATAWAAAW